MFSHSIAMDYGPVLIGGLASSMLSGVLAAQCLMYSKAFANDPLYVKGIVAVVGILDFVHTAIIWSGLWEWVITGFGDALQIDYIPRAIAFSVLFMAITTLLTHWVFGWRIFRLSGNNWLISAPIFGLAIMRLVAAAVSSGEMLHFQRFPLFRKHLMWLFSLGLSISAFVDVYITITMFIILKKSREHSLTLNSIIDSMIIYSFENGLMTSVVTVASLLCWVTMDNLVFLGLHFVASKLYANSTLAVFNYRMHLRRIQESNANVRTGQGVVELFVLPNQAVSPSNEEQPNQTDPFALDQSKQLQNEEMHTDDDSAQNYVNNGNPASGIMKSVTVHFHRD